jgi:hypothetical protein
VGMAKLKSDEEINENLKDPGIAVIILAISYNY